MPQDRIAYVSELYFSDQFLYINDGYGVSWLKTLDAVEALPADIFVPGHGPIPADPEKPAKAFIVSARCWSICATRAKRDPRGATEDQAAAAIKFPQYEQMQGYKSQREVAVRRTYRERIGHA